MFFLFIGVFIILCRFNVEKCYEIQQPQIYVSVSSENMLCSHNGLKLNRHAWLRFTHQALASVDNKVNRQKCQLSCGLRPWYLKPYKCITCFPGKFVQLLLFDRSYSYTNTHTQPHTRTHRPDGEALRATAGWPTPSNGVLGFYDYLNLYFDVM